MIERQLAGILGDEVVANVEPRMASVSLSVRMPWTKKLM